VNSNYAPDRFVGDLDYALMRLVADPKDIVAITVRMLGQYTGADRCDYAEVEADQDHFVILGDYTRAATNTITGRYRLSDFGSLENHACVVDDLEAEPPPGTHIPPDLSSEIRSLVCVPLIKAGHLVAGMAVIQKTPRHWSSQEINLIDTVANRCWESIERIRALRRWKASYEDYRSFIAISSEGIWRFDIEQTIPVTLPVDDQIERLYQFAYLAECNNAMARMYGYDSAEQILGARLGDIMPKSDPKNIEYLRALHASGYHLNDVESSDLDRYGNAKVMLNSLNAIVENGMVVRAWGTLRDITAQKQAEEALRESAYRDSLTQLPNRLLFMEHLEGALKRARRDGHVAGLIFIDVDNFKQINDTFGHQVGDDVLQQVVQRLRQALRDNDTLARFGGDEFVAIVEVAQRSALILVTDNLLKHLRAPFTAAGRELFITASIGVSSYPSDGTDASELLRNADRAMYSAKSEGRDTHRFYAARSQSTSSAKLAFSADLRRALERDELLLHFQPLVDLRSGRIDGLEALVRWHHPSMGLVPPDEFIPIAEESGLILSIERWVMQSAMTEALSHALNQPLKLAINLSMRHFDDPELLNELRTITERVGYDPHLLELELTERGLMRHPRRVLRHLKGFQQLGIHVAVDDFGTGYSCLGLMKRFPLNALKIDRSFVHNCATDRTNQALVAAIIRMGHALGLSVTAEGVETRAQLAYVCAQGCDRAQGSYFSRPISGAKLVALLKGTTKGKRGVAPSWSPSSSTKGAALPPMVR
jgi:diguanylate cyclase (GGDEF)-like protein/PAS domain S-box-containing protein